ncbi:MAG TPA: nitroreductase/quinone reductase family protein [Acidimicrobiia bacterium]|nr:nitroreductase/quinone reductase family protein [Acidimicrobiia bacterium]
MARQPFSRRLLHLIKRPPRLLYGLGLGPLYGRLVLLLTTTGRISGLPRVTPLQYEEIDGAIYVASALGDRADWFRNVVADPRVEVRVRSRRLAGIAEPITDPSRVADFLELRLSRHPRMVGAIMRREGLPPHPERADFERYAARRSLVIIRPAGGPPGSPERGE